MLKTESNNQKYFVVKIKFDLISNQNIIVIVLM